MDYALAFVARFIPIIFAVASHGIILVD